MTATKFIEQGNGEWQTGHPNHALALYTSALELDPENLMAYTQRALVQTHLGNFQDGLADAIKAVALNPEDLAAAYSHGKCLFSLNRFHDAKVVLAKVANSSAPAFAQLAALARKTLSSIDKREREHAQLSHVHPASLGPRTSDLNAHPAMLSPQAAKEEEISSEKHSETAQTRSIQKTNGAPDLDDSARKVVEPVEVSADGSGQSIDSPPQVDDGMAANHAAVCDHPVNTALVHPAELGQRTDSSCPHPATLRPCAASVHPAIFGSQFTCEAPHPATLSAALSEAPQQDIKAQCEPTTEVASNDAASTAVDSVEEGVTNQAEDTVVQHEVIQDAQASETHSHEAIKVKPTEDKKDIKTTEDSKTTAQTELTDTVKTDCELTDADDLGAGHSGVFISNERISESASIDESGVYVSEEPHADH
jgi:hypothetical protein